ncbi:MAG: hypothetical protein M3492_02350 [Actinomycetota bacterium]|nr:hypothetical protein [Actinomycetota bacterium]
MTISTSSTTGGSLPWLQRWVTVLGLACGLALLTAAPAGAHVGDSPAADNFSGSITSISPALPEGISVQIIEFGNRLRLSNGGDEVVSVPGYSSEPYLQIGPDGVQRNDNSPATYLNSSRDGTTPLPERADPQADPFWVSLSSETVYEWHDHRSHWMSALLPPQVRADPDVSHRVIEWTVPLEIDGRAYSVAGVLDWTPPPPGWASYAVLVVLVGTGAAAGWLWRSPRLAAGLLVLAGAGSVWHVASTPLPFGDASSVVYGLLAVLVPTVLVLVLTYFAVRAVRRPPVVGGSGSAPYLIAISGWLLVVEALPDLDVLFRSNVSAIGPAWGARLAVLLLLGLGLGLAIGSVGLMRARPKTVPTSVEPSWLPELSGAAVAASAVQ